MSLRILITGAGGYIGSNVIAGLSGVTIMATDVRFSQTCSPTKDSNIEQRIVDVRDQNAILQLFREFKPDVVLHLASIVTPGKKSNRDFEYAVDVTGTENIVAASVASKVRRLIVTSSGAAYGYHADNPVPLKETDAVRGNYEFAYSHHKRLVEEMLAKHIQTGQLPEVVIFRIGTILGEKTKNQITALFHKKSLPGISGSDSPFVFIWDQDVIGAIARSLQVKADGSFEAPAGVYNLAGDGWLSVDEIAARLGKKVRRWWPGFLKVLFGILKPIGVSRYGPEQVRFLQYRPVLDNAKLKSVFGYTPQKTSAQVLDFYCQKHIDTRSHL